MVYKYLVIELIIQQVFYVKNKLHFNSISNVLPQTITVPQHLLQTNYGVSLFTIRREYEEPQD